MPLQYVVAISAVPGFSRENRPFDGVEEDVIEAIKGCSYVQAFSLTWCDQASV